MPTQGARGNTRVAGKSAELDCAAEYSHHALLKALSYLLQQEGLCCFYQWQPTQLCLRLIFGCGDLVTSAAPPEVAPHL